MLETWVFVDADREGGYLEEGLKREDGDEEELHLGGDSEDIAGSFLGHSMRFEVSTMEDDK